MNEYAVTLTWNGLQAETPQDAVRQFQELLGIRLPIGCVVDVQDMESGAFEEVEVE